MRRDDMASEGVLGPANSPHGEGEQLTFPGSDFAPTTRRVYPLSLRDPDSGNLTEEEMAVVFAMTSRRPEPFDEIARQVTAQKAADFHERWVLGYGHASVAEHAVIHMAVENVSRLACDDLEDNRLAAYTEKSTRYQVMPRGYYHVPKELDHLKKLKKLFTGVCDFVFRTYEEMVEQAMSYLPKEVSQQDGERDSAYRMRLRRQVVDSCRFVLPAATLTNVGVTINARSMEHAIQKLLSSDLDEERQLGEELKLKAWEITPTLVKYADRNDHLVQQRARQRRGSAHLKEDTKCGWDKVALVHYDPLAEVKLVTALYYRFSPMSYAQVKNRVEIMDPNERRKIIEDLMVSMGPHDTPPREFEVVDYTFDFVMDYGAYREFKRHRMQTYIPQPLTVYKGYTVPPLIDRANLNGKFELVMTRVETAYQEIAPTLPLVAQYLVTHAHNRRVLSKLNLRECYHLFNLRTQAQAHFSVREPMDEAMRLAVEAQPALFRYMRLRQYPDWWPFSTLDIPT